MKQIDFPNKKNLECYQIIRMQAYKISTANNFNVRTCA